MYALKGDILQFCLSNNEELNENETRYTFALCPKKIINDDRSVEIRITNKKLGFLTKIDRNFGRFNVVRSDENSLTPTFLTNQYDLDDYPNRPRSSLVMIDIEPDFDEDEDDF